MPKRCARVAALSVLTAISARMAGVVRAFFLQGDHHDKAPGWTAEVMHRLSINCRMTSLAMNSGYRFESMQSSGMRQLVYLFVM